LGYGHLGGLAEPPEIAADPGAPPGSVSLIPSLNAAQRRVLDALLAD
jgi:hypothetical protein